jgi:hypothetical protein
VLFRSNLLESGAAVTLLPGGEKNELLAPLLATNVHTEKTVTGAPAVRRKLRDE